MESSIQTKSNVSLGTQASLFSTNNMKTSVAQLKPRLKPFYQNKAKSISLYQGNCIDIMKQIDNETIDLIFADPPYNLSNGGFTCHAGRMVPVHKGDWDKSRGLDDDHLFNLYWLEQCQRVLKPNGTIWVSGTSHVIYSVGFAMQYLGFKILNDIAWFKPNAAPNLSCRYFTHSHETLLWAAKDKNARHTFHYKDMKIENDGKQMRSVWTIPTPKPSEKKFGKHPTQKPIALLSRIIRSSSNKDDLIFDPFLGSGTTAVASKKLERQFIGTELELDYLSIAKKRLIQVDEKNI